MGELHLDIIKERLKTEYNLSPSVGSMRVAYRESVAGISDHVHRYDTVIGVDRQFAQIGIHISSSLARETQIADENSEVIDSEGENTVRWKHYEKDARATMKKMPHAFSQAIEEGIRVRIFDPVYFIHNL